MEKGKVRGIVWTRNEGIDEWKDNNQEKERGREVAMEGGRERVMNEGRYGMEKNVESEGGVGLNWI